MGLQTFVTLHDYIKKAERLRWKGALNLYEQLKNIPPFSDEVSIGFYIVTENGISRLKCVDCVAKNAKERNELISNFFFINGKEEYVSAQNFGSFVTVINCENDSATFIVENRNKTLIAYSNKTIEDPILPKSDIKKAAQQFVDLLSGKNTVRQTKN